MLNDDIIATESNKIQACDGMMKQRSRKTQIHKMHPVFIKINYLLGLHSYQEP